MADHTAWGVSVVKEVDSPNVKLLYDIYHMQIMEGDLIQTIRDNFRWMGHFHTGGVPGRHELNDQQEIHWTGVMNAIAAMDFKGYVAHEFMPVWRSAYESPGRLLIFATYKCRCDALLSLSIVDHIPGCLQGS